MRKSYQEVIDLIREVIKVAPAAIEFKKSIYKKYGSMTSMCFQKKRSAYTTQYWNDSIILSNENQRILSLESEPTDYGEGNICVPDYDEINFNCGDFETTLLLHEGYPEGDVLAEYNPKTKILKRGIQFTIKNEDDVEAALMQLSTSEPISISTDELWGIISVLNECYKVKSLRKHSIILHTNMTNIKCKHIQEMVVPDEL
jgi:hypothetical protein